jgi:hypothetical protein
VDDIETLVEMALVGVRNGAKGSPGLPPDFVREIGAEDLGRLMVLARADGPPRLRRVRSTHHLAARMVALGKSDVEAGAISGYTPMRVGQLRRDPAFQELVSHYQVEHDARAGMMQERLEAIGLALTEELLERLDSAPEKFSNEELRRWAETCLDRAGAGKQVNVRVQSLSVSLVEQIKRESAERTEVKLLS